MLSIFETICHGKNSIYGRLAAAGIVKPHKYISFYGLRNWAKFGEKFITEQVYIHSKMMIVDDRIAIIGSGTVHKIKVTPFPNVNIPILTEGSP